MDCSLPGSSVHGISQARVLEWVPFPSPGDLPGSGIKPMSSASADGFFAAEPPGKPLPYFSFIHYWNNILMILIISIFRLMSLYLNVWEASQLFKSLPSKDDQFEKLRAFPILT